MRANFSLSAKGTTSSARLCRITVSGFTVLAVPNFFQAVQSSTSFASPLLMVTATAPFYGQPDDCCKTLVICFRPSWTSRQEDPLKNNQSTGSTNAGKPHPV